LDPSATSPTQLAIAVLRVILDVASAGTCSLATRIALREIGAGK